MLRGYEKVELQHYMLTKYRYQVLKQTQRYKHVIFLHISFGHVQKRLMNSPLLNTPLSSDTPRGVDFAGLILQLWVNSKCTLEITERTVLRP